MNRMMKIAGMTTVAAGLLGAPIVLAQAPTDQPQAQPPAQAPEMDREQMRDMMQGMEGMRGMMGMMSQMSRMMETCNNMMEAMLPEGDRPAQEEGQPRGG
jgi:hypothetical protein